MKLDIVYTRESERERLKYTLSKLEFYLEKGHPVNLPGGIVAGVSSYKETLLAVDGEFPSPIVTKAKKLILASWEEYAEPIMKYFESLTFKVPNVVKLILTQYGGGGSYNVNTCEVIVNVKYGADLLSILVHEITHIIVDTELVHKFDLNHEKKENLIKWLISNSALLSKFIEVPRRVSIENPEQAVVDELANRGYVAV